jgi:acetyl-CoA carboxylase biotin carboxyl carrier protein
VSRGGGKEAGERTEGVNGMAHNMTDLEFLRGLIEAVDQSGIDTLEINRAGTRIRIAKTPQSTAGPPSAFHAYAPAPPPPPALTVQPGGAQPGSLAAPAAQAAPVQAEHAPAAASNLIDVKSPMVGTFYRAPAPDAPPYAEVGSHVSRGQTLCILEAMKLMNELESELDGVVREILVEDADPVEFGQVLFRIEPTGSR